MTLTRILLAACLSGAGAFAGLAPAGAAPVGPRRAPGQNCVQPGEQFKPVPWPQQLLAPDRVWPFVRGGGVRVAVLDTGVDANHPQLLGHVEEGFDALTDKAGANDDCAGTGTHVAGVIAARQVAEVGFAGVAPGVTIVPVRIAESVGFGAPPVDPAVLARGITWAVDHAVDVVDVSLPTYTDDQTVRAAVANALGKGTIVVAAVGDQGDTNGSNQTPYPAAYNGVIGVGAIDRMGRRWPASQHGSYVDLVAPGAAVPTAQRGGGMAAADGTGVASGFVAGAAALVHAKRSALPPNEVARVLTATATPSPLGANSSEYGHGVVDPYAAITDHTVAGTPQPMPALVRPGSEKASAWARSRDAALVGASTAMVIVLFVLGVAVAMPRGRRRFWRPALAAPPPIHLEAEEPAPPATLFEEQR